MGSATKVRWVVQLTVIVITAILWIHTSYADNQVVSNFVNPQKSTPLEYTTTTDQQQIPQTDINGPDREVLNSTIQVEGKKLWKLSLLVAEYRQAYEFARKKLQDSIKINEDMSKTLDTQLQLIEEMKSRISVLQNQINSLKAEKKQADTPPLFQSKKDTPTT